MENATQFLTVDLQSQRDALVPEWVHLLPFKSDGEVATNDTRGPYHVADAAEIIAQSFAIADRLPIDQDHATDLAAPKGLPAPARGWIVEMSQRANGIWGRVEWTETGRALLEERAYRSLSPVIAHQASNGQRVIAILRASLVNRPNMRGITALNQETDMSFQTDIATALGLAPDAEEKDITTALNSALSQSKASEGNMAAIAAALGCGEGATAEAVVDAAKKRSGDKDTIAALQSTISELSTSVTNLVEGQKVNRSEEFVDKAIAEKRVGVKPARGHYIAMHQRDPEGTEAIISALPKLEQSHTADLPPQNLADVALNASEEAVAQQLGLNSEDMKGEG